MDNYKGYCVYKIMFPNGKVYIGQTKDIRKRMSSHRMSFKRPENRPIIDAIKKFGFTDDMMKIVVKCEKDDVDYYERSLIKLYNSMDRKFGYNADSGGNKYKEASEETKKKISMSKKGKPFTITQEVLDAQDRVRGVPQRKRTLYEKHVVALAHIDYNGINVYDYDTNTQIGWAASVKYLAEFLDLDRTNIYRVLGNKTKQYKGYSFSYNQ